MGLEQTKKQERGIDLNDFALIDEISGYNQFLNGYMKRVPMPETVKDRIKARMLSYNSEKPKDVALNEIKLKIFGGGR